MIDKNLKVLDLADGVEKLANISSFDVNSTISDSDLMLIEQSTALKKVTIGDLKTEFGGGGGGGIIHLGTSFDDCENTTSEIDIVSVTIPIGIVGVGDIINIEYTYDRLSNAGGINITTKLKNDTNVIWSSTNAVTSGSDIYKISHKIKFFVESIVSNIVTLRTLDSTGIAGITEVQTGLLVATQTVAGATIGNITNNTYDNTSGTTLKITAQWSGASVNRYIRVKQATTYIIKNS